MKTKDPSSSQHDKLSNDIQEEDDNSSPSLCPFTLKPLPYSTPLNIAVMYSSTTTLTSLSDNCGCGHHCSLLPLVDYLHSEGGEISSSGNSSTDRGHDGKNIKSLRKSCPVCGQVDVAIVYDLVAAVLLLSIEITNDTKEMITNMVEQCEVISFRYGRLVYCLSVQTRVAGGTEGSSSRWGGKTALSGTVQERIGHVLGMDASKGLKIIHKGKVIHPDPNSSPADISSHLLDISQTDFRQKKKKPSLVVMGTKIGQETSSTRRSILDMVDGSEGASGGGGPRGYLSLFYWGFSFFYQTVRGFLTGVYLFVRSVFYLPDSDERRDD